VKLDAVAQADPDVVKRTAAAVDKAEFVMTVEKISTGRCPTLYDLVTGSCYMFEPNTPGYEVLMSMLERRWGAHT
jgi:hypothetical protein